MVKGTVGDVFSGEARARSRCRAPVWGALAKAAAGVCWAHRWGQRNPDTSSVGPECNLPVQIPALLLASSVTVGKPLDGSVVLLRLF